MQNFWIPFLTAGSSGRRRHLALYALLLCSSVLVACCTDEDAGTLALHTLSGRLLVHAVNYAGRNDEHRFSVRTHGGALWRLTFAAGIEEVPWPSGTLIKVSGVAVGTDTQRTLQLNAQHDIMVEAVQGHTLSVLQHSTTMPSARQSLGRVVSDISVLTVLVDMCGKGGGPAATTQQAEAVLFDTGGANKQTLQSYYRTCSYGQAAFNRTNSKVIGPVVLPCNGVMADGTTWGSSSCKDTDMYGWAEYVINVTRAMGNINLASYQHIALMLPKTMSSWAGAACDWTGSGQVGPYTVDEVTGAYDMSLIWVSGDFYQDLGVYMHELGHNLYLAHAAKGNCEYCDMSCDMGYCCGVRCFNAPHLWQLGWATPLATLDFEDFVVGTQQLVTLPSQVTQAVNMAMISWRAIRVATTLFVAFRQAGGGAYDSLLSPGFVNGLNVYNFTGGTPQASELTHHLAFIGRAGGMYRNATLGLQLKLVSLSADHLTAVLGVCRFSQAVERNCFDGVDNDCNGLTDAADPACLTATRPAAPPAYPPSPPSPPGGDVFTDYPSQPPLEAAPLVPLSPPAPLSPLSPPAPVAPLSPSPPWPSLPMSPSPLAPQYATPSAIITGLSPAPSPPPPPLPPSPPPPPPLRKRKSPPPLPPPPPPPLRVPAARPPPPPVAKWRRKPPPLTPPPAAPPAGAAGMAYPPVASADPPVEGANPLVA